MYDVPLVTTVLLFKWIDGRESLCKLDKREDVRKQLRSGINNFNQ
jgi:hypothetical protein